MLRPLYTKSRFKKTKTKIRPSEFRRNCADVVVSYLGGDLSLVDKVFRNHEAQEQLITVAPEHPARMFGEVVEARTKDAVAGRKRLLDDFREIVREEMRQNHTWSFNKRSNNHRELMEVGHIVQGEELRRLDESEHLVRIVDFLRDQIEPAAWTLHGRKFKSIFAVELKSAKLRERRDEGLPPPVTFNQGEHRIMATDAYTAQRIVEEEK